MKVVVTRKIPGNGIKLLQDAGFEVVVGQQDAPMNRDELLLTISGADAVLTQLQDKVDEEFLNAAGSQLKVVANYAVGFDNFDLEALERHNVVGTNTPDVLTEAVAEHTFALIFAIGRRIVEADREARKQYLGFGPEVLLGIELKGKTLGVLGLGRIGSRVAEIGKAIGMNIIYYDVKQNPDFENKTNAQFKSTPDELLKEADIVSIHVPLLDSTRHLINAERLKLMKSTAYLVNTSRGPVVDEAALAEALKNKTIAGAALDVFEHEPKLTEGLESLDNVVVTPHIASASIEARSAMGELAAKNIIEVLSGREPLTPVKKKTATEASQQSVANEIQSPQSEEVDNQLYDTIIIGGGPGGVAAAVYAARKKMKAVVITESFGGQSIVSDDIQNWIGEPHISGLDLAKKLEAHVRAYPDMVKIISPEKVVNIQAVRCNNAERLCDFEVRTESGKVFQGKTIILAAGARRRKLGVPGEDKFGGKGVAYCSTCDAPLFRDKKVAVIGGGNAGLEAVNDLFQYASEVYLLDFGSELRGDPVTIEEIKKNPKLKAIILNAETLEIFGENFVTGLKYKDRNTGEEKVLEVGGVFVEIGSVPNTEMVKDLVTLDKHGQVMINAMHATTSHPGVFAAGDITDDPYKQNNISAGDGVRAALAAYAYLQKREKVTPAAG